MTKHLFNVIKSAVDHLNPRQTPMIAFDQQLYVLEKQVHWYWPDRYSEDTFMVIFGGLQISGMLAWEYTKMS